MKASTLAVLLAGAALLAGCGGGSDDDGGAVVAPDPIPASASANPEGFIAFLRGLVNSETAEPVAVDKFTPPTSETANPVPLS